ncbi:MAG TPA: hypothetical protein VNT81_21040 [Vicinamibacterales bacterium]|nr:hypothetical protein [Vicinamibacterales bacterium]
MQWDVYPDSIILSAGVEVQVSRFLHAQESQIFPVAGDSFVVDFPDNTKAGGSVISSSATGIVADIAGARWAWEQLGTPSKMNNGLFKLRFVVKGRL